MEHPQLVSNTLLVLPIYSLASNAHLAPLIDYATNHTSSRLLILLVSPLFHPQTGIHPSTHWSDLQRLLSSIYSKVSATALRHDRVLLRIDVLVHGGNDAPISGIIDSGIDNVQWGACYVAYERTYVRSCGRGGLLTTLCLLCVVNENLIPAWIRTHVKSRVPNDLLVPTHAVPANTNEVTTIAIGRSKRPRYGVAAMGGTFDHLHAGHKVLLSMAAWIAEEKLIVGVTGGSAKSFAYGAAGPRLQLFLIRG
jgi:pantetheine-phosphate adenylyltransferase